MRRIQGLIRTVLPSTFGEVWAPHFGFESLNEVVDDGNQDVFLTVWELMKQQNSKDIVVSLKVKSETGALGGS